MKTAEEWTKHIREAGNHLSTEHLFEVEIPAVVKEIQLDAIREGMRRARKLVNEIEVDGRNPWCVREEAFKSIFYAAEQLTTKDL